jgi:hypothetical protein
MPDLRGGKGDVRSRRAEPAPWKRNTWGGEGGGSQNTWGGESEYLWGRGWRRLRREGTLASSRRKRRRQGWHLFPTFSRRVCFLSFILRTSCLGKKSPRRDRLASYSEAGSPP